MGWGGGGKDADLNHWGLQSCFIKYLGSVFQSGQSDKNKDCLKILGVGTGWHGQLFSQRGSWATSPEFTDDASKQYKSLASKII